jgi:hypothetical protein
MLMGKGMGQGNSWIGNEALGDRIRALRKKKEPEKMRRGRKENSRKSVGGRVSISSDSDE